jgi:hypothetical protein
VGIALTHIFGIGRNRALMTCKAAGVDASTAGQGSHGAGDRALARRHREVPRRG